MLHHIFVCAFLVISTTGQLSTPVCDRCRSTATCKNTKGDVIILYHSSSTFGVSRHERTKQFVSEVFKSFQVGDCTVNVALFSFDQGVEVLLDLESSNAPHDVAFAVASLEQGETDPDITPALQLAAETFSSHPADSVGALRTLIVITDSEFQLNDNTPVLSLLASRVATFGVGIGNNVKKLNLQELTLNPNRTFIVQDIYALGGPNQQFIIDSFCHDVDECTEMNGGCSHQCVNTDGSYRCECPENLLLSPADLRTCLGGLSADEVPHPCMQNNGGCCQVCVENPEGHNCSCFEGYVLDRDMITCIDFNECLNQPCSHGCVNTEGSYFCECPEDYRIMEDFQTCEKRPGLVDCPEGFDSLSHSCVMQTNETVAYEEASQICLEEGSRLVKINDGGTRSIISRTFMRGSWIGLQEERPGVWRNSDGSLYTYQWAYNEPSLGRCGMIDHLIFASPCDSQQFAICEIPRLQGLLIFTSTWSGGAQGKLHLPTDVAQVLVRFPFNISSFQTWHGTVSRVNGREYIVMQSDVERQSNNGHVGFFINFGTFRFPDYRVEIDVLSS